MQSEVENLSGLSRKIRVTVPQDNIQKEFDKRIKDLAKNANIKGFRKGKVPTSVVKMQFGEALRQEVIQEILWETLQQAFKEQNLYPAGSPHIELINMKEDAPLQYEATFEVFPDVKIDIEGITVEKPTTKVEEEHVNEVIDKLLKQNVKWNDVDRPAQANDLVIIDFEGFIDGVAFEGGTAKDFRLELSKGMMIPGFEDPLIGASKDDTVETNLVFPEDYHAKQYAGKSAKFVITIHKVMAPELPELDDTFAADLGVAEGTVESLKQEVRQNLENELERRIRDKVKLQIIEKMLEKNVIEVPKASIEQETKRLQQQLQKQFSMQGVNNPPMLPNEQFEEQARKNVVLGLLLSQWIQENEIEVDVTRVRDRVDQIASGYHRPHEIVNWYYGNKDALSEIEAAVLEEQAIDKILESIDVVEKDASFEELMKVGAQRGDE